MAIIVIIILSILLLFIIRAIKRSPSYKGQVGESKVSHILRALPRQYLVINNVIIPNQQATSQIDHIVISPFGIFVIETKNYKGWIFGSEDSKMWKETFKTTEGKYFRNPIKQNWGHVYALSEYLDLDRRVFKPIVVFSDDAELNIEVTSPVIYMSQLKQYILSYRQEIISQENADLIFNSISKTNLVGEDIEKAHVQSVKDNMERHRISLREGKCPRCGGTLVLRNGKYGEFYGCSNYPKCKFTNNLR